MDKVEFLPGTRAHTPKWLINRAGGWMRSSAVVDCDIHLFTDIFNTHEIFIKWGAPRVDRECQGGVASF